MSKLTDKRLAMEVAALRQSFWRRPGQVLGEDDFEDEGPPPDA